MKGIILLADGFEDIEAVATIDLIKRGNIRIDIISMNDTIQVTSKSKITYNADYLLSQINYEEYDYLIIPGGMAVETYYLKSMITEKIVKHFEENKKLIACICAAPSILGKLGYLDNQKFTCFPSYEKYMKKGYYEKEKRVIIEKNHITSKAAGTSFEFAYEIIKYLTSEENARNVLKNIYY